MHFAKKESLKTTFNFETYKSIVFNLKSKKFGLNDLNTKQYE